MLYIVDDFSGLPVASFETPEEADAYIEKARAVGNQDVSVAQWTAEEHSRQCGGCDWPECFGPA